VLACGNCRRIINIWRRGSSLRFSPYSVFGFSAGDYPSGDEITSWWRELIAEHQPIKLPRRLSNLSNPAEPVLQSSSPNLSCDSPSHSQSLTMGSRVVVCAHRQLHWQLHTSVLPPSISNSNPAKDSPSGSRSSVPSDSLSNTLRLATSSRVVACAYPHANRQLSKSSTEISAIQRQPSLRSSVRCTLGQLAHVVVACAHSRVHLQLFETVGHLGLHDGFRSSEIAKFTSSDQHAPLS
jgi:hypothetical protein